MALWTLARAGGPACDEVVERSRNWLQNNELGVSMIDVGVGTIWRDIERDEGFALRQARRVRSLLGSRGDGQADRSQLRLNRETRPYEWAWYLFASALNRAGKNSLSLV